MGCEYHLCVCVRVNNLKQSNEGLQPGHLVVVLLRSQTNDDVGQIRVSLKLTPKAVLVHRVDDGPGGVGQHLETLKVHLTEGQV